MNREDLDLEYLDIDQLAREFWQDDLAKFFLKQIEPTYSEYRMYQAGFEKALEYQRCNKENDAIEKETLQYTIREIKEQLKNTLAFIDAMEELE